MQIHCNVIKDDKREVFIDIVHILRNKDCRGWWIRSVITLVKKDMCVCVCVGVYIYIYIYICRCMWGQTCTNIYLSMCVCVYFNTIHKLIYIYIYIHIYTIIHTYVHIYTNRYLYIIYKYIDIFICTERHKYI